MTGIASTWRTGNHVLGPGDHQTEDKEDCGEITKKALNYMWHGDPMASVAPSATISTNQNCTQSRVHIALQSSSLFNGPEIIQLSEAIQILNLSTRT